MKTTTSAAVLITGLLSTVVTGNVSAVPIAYTDFVGDVAVVISTTTYNCTSLANFS